MPYDIAKGFDGCPYAVVKLTPDGRELAPGGCHQTAIEAGKHLAALQAATDYEDRAAGEWVIVDIDGTLTTSDGSDEPRESLVSWMQANDYSYAIVSARPDSRLEETRAWLESNDIPHSSVSLSDFPQGPNAGVAFKKSKAEQLVKNHKIVFAIDNDPAARSAYESAGVKAVGPTTVRYFQLGLELRHPGHADQSVHNPHKGGGYVIGSKSVATPEQAAARIKENSALFASRGGVIKTGDQIKAKDAAAQRLELEAEAAGVFGPSTLENQGVSVDAAITKNNEIIRMPDGPAKDAARAEYDLLSQRQEGIGHTARTLAFRKDEGKGGQDVESVNSFYLTEPGGKVVAGGTLNHYKSGPGLTGDTELFYLGSTGKIPGAGSAIMGQVILSAAARKSPRIVIRAEVDARPFYRAMGFKGDMIMTMDASVIQQIAEAIK